MAIVKSKLLKQLSDNYPNFLKKDLDKSLNIVLNEIKLALLKGENVELRDFGTWSLNTQKARLSRNPKSGPLPLHCAQIIARSALSIRGG